MREASAENGSSAPRHLISISKYVPYRGIPHAGGQYLVQHFRALERRYGIDLIAPSTPLNRDALTRPSAFGGRVELLAGRGPLRHGRLKLAADLHSVIRGSAATADFTAEFRRDRRLAGILADARLVEFQWSEMGSLSPLLRRLAPRAAQVLVAHDVITQRWRRRALESRSPAVRSAYSAAASRSAVRERRSLEAVDRVLVFSEKDAEIALNLAPGASVEVVPPGLADVVEVDPGVARDADAPPTVLFTGAMNRADNHEGVSWLLHGVWPAVVEAVPSARLVVAGANPPANLVEQAAAMPSVTLTGYVESLEPYYAGADVMAVPLFTGAGVKFKTIDAMLRGIPVVTTSVGAEGLGGPEHYAAVTEDPQRFARAIIDELRRPDADRAARTREWASSRFGFEAFAERLLGVYEEVAA
ncbi:glycosyltransferase [Agromyces intestinalis]|uniref:Glycosyltransferase n=1 Tax=Agromyces intestinalis TaxID=2592652 RepID=A0A5C1YDP1_9MICO|nr:glycosyltransferase [Agromyces intestinalis]QEO13535.1 glycosyltransferase [Agromyces intestinalis]